MTIARRRLVLLAAACLMGCVPLSGGWDVEALLMAEPELAAIPEQRIGDMTPYPAWLDGRLLLVVCRYAPAANPISVFRPEDGRHATWTRRTVEAVGRALPEVSFETSSRVSSEAGRPSGIRLLHVDDPDAKQPAGAGDTLAECDVSRSPSAPGGVQGKLVRSEIRLREVKRDAQGRVHRVTELEWVASLVHELGHALGYSGHAGWGDSPLVLDEKQLRRLARQIRQGDALALPNLRALYRIEPGRILGEADISIEGRERIRAVERLIADRHRRLGPSRGPFASAGDRAARIVWVWNGGLQAGLRFPDWRQELREGRPITVIADGIVERTLVP